MEQLTINRPAAPENKIRTSNDFELCYLRHQYFRRVKYNPTEEEMLPYQKIVSNLSKNTYNVYENLFKAVGMYFCDIENIGRVHLVSFLGLYSLEKKPENKKKFIVRFKIDHNDKDPTEKDFEDKNKANFTCFYKQRMEDLVRVCRQKIRNVKGQPSEEYAIFKGTKKPPKYPRSLLKNHEDLGYKKIDFSTFKSIRKKAHVNADATFFQFANTWYIAIALEQKPLELEDLVSSGFDPSENEHYMQADALIEKEENEKENRNLTVMFNNKTSRRKAFILRKFVAKNKNKAQYKDEVAIAKKLLKSLGN